MNILITGLNEQQCDPCYWEKRSQLKVIPSHPSLVACLRAMGHEVTQRAVACGEDLGDYDKVIVFLSSPKQAGSIKFYNGAWALYARPDAIIAYDDWQVRDIWRHLVRTNDVDRLLDPYLLHITKTKEEDLAPYLDELLEGVRSVAHGGRRVLLSTFSTDHLDDTYGPHLLLPAYDKTKLVRYNPNPFHCHRQAAPAKKARQFNFASLVQGHTRAWLKRQGFIGNVDSETGLIRTWPIDLYGSRKNSQKRLTEDQMVNVYGKDWACLMPGYDHAGSGWWRARPTQVADAGSILIGDEREMKVLYGDSPLATLKADDLVEASDAELVTIATEQREALYALHPLDKSVQVAEVARVLV